MTDTQHLIAALSASAKPVRPVRPGRYMALMLLALSVYAVCAQCWLEGFRPDLAVQLGRPLFLLELVLLSAMFAGAVAAAVYAMLPDAVHYRRLLWWPYVASALMLGLVLLQLMMPHDPRMVMPDIHAHTHQCTQYIAASAIIPALLVFGMLRLGATVMPARAGTLAVIAAVSVGALTLRLAEPNDQILHLLIWHYLPSLGFAVLGAIAGRLLLRW